MRMLNLQNLHNNKKMIKLKKSQMLLIGSLLVFVGILLFSWDDFLILRDEVYSEMKIEIVSKDYKGFDHISTVPVANNVVPEPAGAAIEEEKKEAPQEINYDKYLGVLQIPKIGLKRGFYDITSKYNDIEHNVTLIKGSNMPDVPRGNLMLMAHSGDAYISYFAYLYQLNIGDVAYVTYNKIKYKYVVSNIYTAPKVGRVNIERNYNKTTLTLITCTKDDDTTHTIYILEQV